MTLGVLAGTGLYEIPGVEDARLHHDLTTPWGAPTGVPMSATLEGTPVVFLPRHGASHDTPPHRVNYRANIAAIRALGVERVVAVAAVGAIDTSLRNGALACPTQIIDYTWGRESTFHDGSGASDAGLGLGGDGASDLGAGVQHVDFTEPYCAVLREGLAAAARAVGVDVAMRGCYAATQGPRLESAAEVDRLDRDGCTLIGMTGMPEAGLAREAGLRYAHLCVVVNAAAGRGAAEITMDEIRAALATGMADAVKVVRAVAAAQSG